MKRGLLFFVPVGALFLLSPEALSADDSPLIYGLRDLLLDKAASFRPTNLAEQVQRELVMGLIGESEAHGIKYREDAAKVVTGYFQEIASTVAKKSGSPQDIAFFPGNKAFFIATFVADLKEEGKREPLTGEIVQKVLDQMPKKHGESGPPTAARKSRCWPFW